MLKKLFPGLVLFTTVLFPLNALADVVINGTRIVFNAKDKESVVQLKNQGNNPYLLQLWIDDGNADARPGNVTVPFLITPPVVRIDPAKGQAVRIMATNPALPQDRESVFWFNMLEIPPKAQASKSGKTHMQLAFRTRIKMFYRPDNLQSTPLQAYKELKISLQGNNLKVKNESPYHVTFSKIEIRQSKDSTVLATVEKFPQRMVKPKSEIIFPLVNKNMGALRGASVFYRVINDFGGETTNEQKLQNSP
ncbi:fimbrial assembly protein [Citrobacter amalonaticus]|uniref:Fimbrial assembly protein n=1 Tax=Citrobacter amalonaticus TaxID=35703 RepID=A0A2S4RS01_CITAM|nr:fimbria/pilus periplasmic chaperone [Citrobacter amalonaticus]POT55721.1 fimbrial assembly protein [Citrobacter amalonaticus]POT73934.1 fimbrial assembly protein [Citrobacter amalonaticus]POU62294.1 fimbrial assembly protein [Citrobacter amalonaticus]POV02796.1 fimbrial assembly protein [Citrobacter amalonaticus]